MLFDICRDMEELCPDALLLQYVNPMAINCWAIKEKFPHIKTVGLCHSVQETSHQLAEILGEKPEDLNYLCAGINHVAFYLKFEKVLADGSREDLYPRLKAIAENGPIPDGDRVRFEMLQPRRPLRDRIQRALLGVHLLVHQARPAGPARQVQPAPSVSTSTAASARSTAGTSSATTSKAPRRSKSSSPTSMPPASSARW